MIKAFEENLEVTFKYAKNMQTKLTKRKYT